MHKVKAVINVPSVRIKLNTLNNAPDQWAQIIDNKTGQVLHTGQPKYIKRVAAKRYMLKASL